MKVLFEYGNKTEENALMNAKMFGHLVETRLNQRYPDLEVIFMEQQGYLLTFKMNFTNRDTSESDLRSRLFDFIRDYPNKPIMKLEFISTKNKDCD